jgi:hypothetical protein
MRPKETKFFVWGRGVKGSFHFFLKKIAMQKEKMYFFGKYE